MKKLFALILALLLVLSLAACGGSAPSQSLVLRASTPSAPEHAWSKCLDEIAAEVEAKTNGRIKIDVYYNASLSENSEKTMTEQIMTGTLDLGIAPSALAGPKFSAFSVPFQFDNREHIYRVFETQAAKDLLALTESTGLHSMGYVENGFRQITNNVRPIKTPEDLHGIKIRTPQAATTMAAVTAMGANATAMNAGELYVALSQGTVDGQENALNTIYNNGYYEVQKYCTVIDYNWSPAILVFNAELWNSFSAEDQKLIEEIVATAIANCNAKLAAEDLDFIQKLEEKGMEVYVLTAEERAAFKALCDSSEELKAAYEKSVGADILEVFGAAVEDCR